MTCEALCQTKREITCIKPLAPQEFRERDVKGAIFRNICKYQVERNMSHEQGDNKIPSKSRGGDTPGLGAAKGALGRTEGHAEGCRR